MLVIQDVLDRSLANLDEFVCRFAHGDSTLSEYSLRITFGGSGCVREICSLGASNRHDPPVSEAGGPSDADNIKKGCGSDEIQISKN